MNKKICIIGYSSNLGKSICNILSKNFELVLGNSSNCDVTNDKSINDFFNKIDYIDGLIYCSAYKESCDPLGDDEEFIKSININLIGAIKCLKQAYKKCNKNSKFVTIGSADGTFANFNKSNYCISKCALHQYTKCFACKAKEKNSDAICVVPGTLSSEEDFNSVAKFINFFMSNDININAQLIRIDKGHHTFAL